MAAAEAYAARVAVEDGVRYLDIRALQSAIERRDRESVYCIDVRTREEYAAGHIPGFRWFPGGQAVQRSDEVAVVKNCPIVFSCDGKARATVIASWYRQMGFAEVYAVDGGTAAWVASGRSLETGMPDERPVGYDEARHQAVRKRASVGCWLYGVAHRIALRTRDTAARRESRLSRYPARRRRRGIPARAGNRDPRGCDRRRPA